MTKKQSQLETRLRSEAAQWAEHVAAGRKSVLTQQTVTQRKGTSSTTRNWYQAASLAAGIALMVLGGWLLSGSSPADVSEDSPQAMLAPFAPTALDEENQGVDQVDGSQVDVDLETLQVTNRVLQSVIVRAAQGTQDAVEQSISEMAILDSSHSLEELSQSSSETIRSWAREPGRRYGAAAKWFDGSLVALSDSSLQTARRILSRGNP